MMKTKTTITIALLLFVSLSALAGTVPVTILFTGDVHSYLSPDRNGNGGVARIAGYYKKARQEIDNLLILDAGDMVTGTPASTMFGGDPIFFAYNHLGLDAAAIGNHEFDYTWKRIAHFCKIANFPLLCGNASYTDENELAVPLGDAPYLIFDRGGVKIAVLGVVTEWTPKITKAEDTAGVRFVPAAEALRRMVKQVEGKADIVVALTHIGIEDDRKVAQDVAGIDLILGGHSHTYMEKAEIVNGVPIVHSGSKGRNIGRVGLTVDTDADRIAKFQFQPLAVTPDLAPEDPETAKTVKEWEDKVSGVVDRPLGTAARRMHQIDMLMLANDAFLEACGGDYSYHNPGGTRGSLPQGAFTYREIWNIFPFANTIVMAEVKGRDIPEHFYGHEPIEPDKTYKIVTNSFVRDQVETILPELKGVKWLDTGVDIRDAVIQYIEKRKTIAPVKLTR